MPLNDLNYDELCSLRRIVNGLYDAYAPLRAISPVHFDLTPGAQVMIRIEALVPGLEGAVTPSNAHADLAARLNDLEFMAEHHQSAVEILRQAFSTSSVLERHMALLRVERGLPALDDDTGDTETTSPEASRSAGETPDPPQGAAPAEPGDVDGDGGAVMAAAIAPVATLDADPAAPAAAMPLPWSEEEDQQLVERMAFYMRNGMTMSYAVKMVAPKLGRPVEGALWRCKNKLRDRIAATIASSVQADPAPEPAPVAPAPAAIEAGESLTEHLQSLQRKGDWTIAQDITMLDLMVQNWTMGEISQDMNIGGHELKRRWDLLSDLHEVDESRKMRSFTAADILAALRLMAPKAG